MSRTILWLSSFLPGTAMSTASTSATIHRLVLPVEGMTCASCSARVEKAIAAVSGVRHVAVNLATDSVAIDGDNSLSANVIRQAIVDAGYTVPTREVTLAVGDMTCASCVGRVEKAL